MRDLCFLSFARRDGVSGLGLNDLGPEARAGGWAPPAVRVDVSFNLCSVSPLRYGMLAETLCHSLTLMELLGCPREPRPL